MDGAEALYLAAQPVWLWLNFIGIAALGAFALWAIAASGGSTGLRARRRAPALRAHLCGAVRAGQAFSIRAAAEFLRSREAPRGPLARCR